MLRFENSLSYDTAKILMHAFVTSRIDPCNALLFGLPNFLIQRLQYVLNSAARVIARSRKFDQITPLPDRIALVTCRAEDNIFKRFYYLNLK